jgi:hypothetical protein
VASKTRQTSSKPTSYRARPFPYPPLLGSFKSLPGRIEGAREFGIRPRGQRRPPSSSSRRRSTDRVGRCNTGSPEPMPALRSGIHPRGYLCAATACCGSVTAPKRTKTSRYPAQGAFYPGSRIRTSENRPSTHSGEYRTQRTVSGKKSTHSFPLPVYSEAGGLPQAPGRDA